MTETNGKKVQQISRKQFAIRKTLWILLVVVGLFILFDITPFGGNITFYSKWVECGRKPVSVQSAPGAGIVWYEETESFQPVRFLYQKYYCTPLQAEEAGYSANSKLYDFPHLQNNRSQ